MSTTSSLSRLFVLFFAALAFSLFSASSAFAQDDDFNFDDEGGDDFNFDEGGDDGGGGGDEGGDDFNFDDGGGDGGGDVAIDIQMPDGSKPIIIAWFDPVEATDQRVLDRLTQALVTSLGEFEDYDTVNGIVLKQELDKMSDEDRENCIYDPVCMAEKGAELSIQKIVVGRIQIEGRERPSISLELIDVDSQASENYLEFQSSPTVRGQERELRPAAYKTFNRPIPREGNAKSISDSIDEEKEWIGMGQLIAVIAVGVTAVGLTVGGAVVGLDAAALNDEVLAAKGAGTLTQVQAQAKFDEASEQALVANVLYGLAGVAAVTAVVLLFVRPGEEIAEDQNVGLNDFYVSPTLHSDGAGLATGFTF